MKNDVETFVSWLKQFELALPDDVASKITVGPASSNRSAYIDLEAVDGRMGRLILHEFGGATAEIFDCNGEQLDLSLAVKKMGGWERVSSEKFDEAFEPFTNLFLTSESTI
ncbi:MAG: hypothetical protein ABJF89_15975 [Parasphingorhabdus sp.]|uniref:immunity protein TriTu family protein n=2 Tax=Parasphingorhabdus sp. TaxID=2709688 RepID=UPI00326692C1